jgi:hypothetical protein
MSGILALTLFHGGRLKQLLFLVRIFGGRALELVSGSIHEIVLEFSLFELVVLFELLIHPTQIVLEAPDHRSMFGPVGLIL